MNVAHKLARQRGVAIIMAMLIVALATSVAAYAAWQQNLWMRQSINLGDQAQSLVVSRAALNLGSLALIEDLTNPNTSQNDHLDEAWAKYNLVTPVEGGGSVSGKITDSQGLFNVNNLAATDLVQRSYQLQWFTAMLGKLNLPTGLADALQDYVDDDSQGPKEDLNYLGKPEPYRTANQPLQSIDELARVEGFDEKVIETLRPFVTAITEFSPPTPGTSAPLSIPVTPLNVNTAPGAVLEAVFGASAGPAIEKLRDDAPFKDDADFDARTNTLLPPVDPKNPAAHPWSPASVGVKSNYFLIVATSRFGNTKNGLAALVHRINPTSWPSTVWQKQILD